jgi:IS5 family transposase
MSHQLTFVDSDFNWKRSKTRKEIFLARMDAVLSWSRMLVIIEPIYPKANNGRHPYPLDTKLRIHCMQQWYKALFPKSMQLEWN